jgi:hypothetical protein
MANDKTSVSDELLKLAQLKEKGVLSDEEFASAKAALLRTLHATAPPETQTCSECKGSGKCPDCDGEGESIPNWCDPRIRAARPKNRMRTCTECAGGGRCHACQGHGSIGVKK